MHIFYVKNITVVSLKYFPLNGIERLQLCFFAFLLVLNQKSVGGSDMMCKIRIYQITATLAF